jgi:DNA-binding NarL/FixJ family response regulator
MVRPHIRLVIADKQVLFRGALRTWLDEQPDFDVVAEAVSLSQVFSAIPQAEPDVVIVHVGLTSAQGLASAMSNLASAARILVLGERDDLDLVTTVLDAGASGYLTKEAGVAELAEAIRQASAGEFVIPSHLLTPLLDRLLRRRRESQEAARRIAQLTRRERAVLALLTDGANNQSIATILGISTQTARTHVQNLLGKLDVHSKLEAAAFVLQHGIRDELADADPPISITTTP